MRLNGNGGVDMSARELKMVSIQISHKFASIEDAQRIVKSLIEYIRYTCKQRKCFCQGIIAISDVKSSSVERVVTDNTKERGRPKLVQIPSASEIKRGVMQGQIYKVRLKTARN